VTGANRGIGQALVEEALRRGAKRSTQFAAILCHPDERASTPLLLEWTGKRRFRGAEPGDIDVDVVSTS